MLEVAAANTTSIHGFAQLGPEEIVSEASPTYDYQSWSFNPCEYTSDAAGLLFCQEKLRSELSELERLPDNWDGEGAVPLSQSVLQRVRLLIAGIVSAVSAPALVPNSNGTISLEWESGDRFLQEPTAR